MPNLAIHHPKLVHDLELISEKYSKETGYEIFNVSHWDAGEDYRGEINKSLRLTPEGSRFEYEFSQTLPTQLTDSVAAKLGLLSDRFMQITPSGTNANLLALVLLKIKGRKRLIIVGPCYFHVPVLAQSLGLEVVHAINWSSESRLSTSFIGLHNAKEDAIWITNPIYCFGHAYINEQREDAEMLLEMGYAIVADECNSMVGTELGRTLNRFKNFIGTYSPHKSVCVNGLKFGALNVAISEISVIRFLGDSWSGPLPRSIKTDMLHFVSENFSAIENIFRSHLAKNERLLHLLINRLPVKTYIGTGHFRVITVNGASRNYETSLKIFEKIIADSQCAFIPMICNYGPETIGFSFRINLLADMPKMIEKLPLLIDSISQRCQ